MDKKSILITGATGLTGSSLVDLLKDDSSFREIIILSRKKIPGLDDKKFTQHITEFNNPSSFSDLVKADAVVCAIGTTIKKAGSQARFSEIDYGLPIEIAKAAYNNGTENFILVSAIGADPSSKIFYNRVKGELERDLSEIKFKSIHILRPSLLMGNRNEIRPGERFGQIMMPILSFLLPYRFRPVHVHTLALKIRELALNETTGKHIYVGKELYPEK